MTSSSYLPSIFRVPQSLPSFEEPSPRLPAGKIRFLSYVCFKETFRVKCSAPWQKAKQQAIERHQQQQESQSQRLQSPSLLSRSKRLSIIKIKARS